MVFKVSFPFFPIFSVYYTVYNILLYTLFTKRSAFFCICLHSQRKKSINISKIKSLAPEAWGAFLVSYSVMLCTLFYIILCSNASYDAGAAAAVSRERSSFVGRSAAAAGYICRRACWPRHWRGPGPGFSAWNGRESGALDAGPADPVSVAAVLDAAAGRCTAGGASCAPRPSEGAHRQRTTSYSCTHDTRVITRKIQ